MCAAIVDNGSKIHRKDIPVQCLPMFNHNPFVDETWIQYMSQSDDKINGPCFSKINRKKENCQINRSWLFVFSSTVNDVIWNIYCF